MTFQERARPSGRSVRPAARPRMTRADKSEATRRKLIAAATYVVGHEGYANASVAKITARARVAQGTFYNYFATQQDLFDQLLPELGRELLEHIRRRLAGTTDTLAREEIGFRAFFEFLAATPEFYRILNEAETFSPKAFRDHLDNMTQGYLRALRRAKRRGELAAYSDAELEVMVCILLAARNYIAYRFVHRDGTHGGLPVWVTPAYMKFIADGSGLGASKGRARRRRATTVAEPESQRAAILVEHSGTDGSPARLVLHVAAGQRDAHGTRHAVLVELVEAAASAIADRGRAPRLIDLSLGFLTATRARRLVAVARCEQRDAAAIRVAVEVHEESAAGPVVTTGLALFVAERTAATET